MFNFWYNKKVLITGHTGFVGAWLSVVLSYLGAEVLGFSLEEEENSLYKKIKHKIRIESAYGDIRDYVLIERYISNFKPDIIFHLAAFGFIKECFDDPERAFSTNVQGTLNLMQAVRKHSCGIVIASSDKVYKNNNMKSYLFKEEDALGGSDPYSASKTCQDILAQSFCESYLDEHYLCIVRPSNILGGGDHNKHRLIPSIYHSLKNGYSPEIRNPDAIRPWQNVLDMVAAYLKIAEGAKTSIYNVGPEDSGIKTVGEIVAYITRLYGKTDFYTIISNELKEKSYLGLSIEKIKKELNWWPKRTLEQTLDEIFEFYENDRGKNTYDLCMSLIKDYYGGDINVE